MPAGATVASTANMAFIGTEKNVPVNFVSMELSIETAADEDEGEEPEEYTWTMDVGYIALEYATPDYGINFVENMLGLAPMSITGTPTLDNRQFLY